MILTLDANYLILIKQLTRVSVSENLQLIEIFIFENKVFFEQMCKKRNF